MQPLNPYQVTTKSTQQLLSECVENAIDKDSNEFAWDTFFRSWFREYGIPCYFLFKRNLGVTNTQYVELLSLLQIHSCSNADKQKKHLLFHTTEHVKATVEEAVSVLLESPETNRKSQTELFAATYADVFASTVAVDVFYCSCAVFLPPGLCVELENICADAGYLHSAGRSIFVRNIKKARHKELDDSIAKYLSSMISSAFPIPFVVYAHEDFSAYDKDSREQINRGIENTKLHVDKMSMGSLRLSHILQELKTKYAGKLEIPEPGPYDENHNFRKSQTLWLISDRSLSQTNPTNPGTERYYICYEQRIKNNNPFFYFDENKPAWKSHTTMPHSLTSALINAARPFPDGTTICDPFGGTGTTWFEVKRLVPDTVVRCSDLTPAVIRLVRDNLTFFLMDAEKLLTMSNELATICETAKAAVRVTDKSQRTFEFLNRDEGLTGYYPALRLLDDLKKEQPREDQEFVLTSEFVGRLEKLDLTTRVTFYALLRAFLRNQGGYKRKAINFEKAFCDSMAEMISQIDQLVEVKRDAKKATIVTRSDRIVFQCVYSSAVVPSFFMRSFEYYEKGIDGEVYVSDARKLESNSIDVLICDPPYGFNTSEDQSELAKLYSEFVDSALRAVRDNGHLIICLPAESYTGRNLPYCTKSNLVISQILVKARALGRMAFIPASSLPGRLFSPPYYWEAERALRRTILHFRITGAMNDNVKE